MATRAHRSRIWHLVVWTAVGGVPAAQTGVEWAEVERRPDGLVLSQEALVSADETEVDFELGDLDQDGWSDVVVARKEAGSFGGKRTNLLLMNEAGVLVDRSTQFAVASDVPGDQGFLTPTNDRDLVLSDVDQDGWLDVVTATTLSLGAPKAISHPRVYRNLGGAGPWMGLFYEEARIPQLWTVGGLAVAPRFCDVAAGDVDHDGAPDLHFTDYDSTQTGFLEAASDDLDDRLLLNDGQGYFSDSGTSMLSSAQLQSAFGLTNRIADVNGDGLNDVLKMSSLGVPYDLLVYYNSHAQGFAITQTGTGTSTGYGFELGDLNGDGRLDLVIQDDGADRYRINQGNDLLGRVQWGPKKTFSFVGGHDDGFGHKVRIHDLDGDGRQDVFVCDSDIEFQGCSRRMHVYHNTVGSNPHDLILVEEAELASGNLGPGWKGVVGLLASDLRGTSDVGLGDYDRDGDVDMLLENCAGIELWDNRAVVCQDDLGFAGPGALELSLCGDDLLEAGSGAELRLAGAVPGAPTFLVVGTSSAPVSLWGGTLVPAPAFGPPLELAADALGAWSLPVAGGGSTAAQLVLQVLGLNGTSIEFSNALAVEIGL